MRYINVDAFINDKLSRICSKCDRRKSNDGKRFIYAVGEAPCRACELGDMMDEIDDFPTADVEEVRHGEWIPILQTYHWGDTGVVDNIIIGYRCSVCDVIEKSKYKYCHCGARMDGGEE